MKLSIGHTIRKLRRSRDLTQEELAEALGVSFQSVSRWETETCYPDVELLPAIAGFFGISADQLLGMDTSQEEKQIQAVLDDFQQAISRGDVARCIVIAREGLKEHPGSYALMNKLMYALFVSGDDTGNLPDWRENMERYDEEITHLGERILRSCPDPAIRLEATARLAFNHCEMGRKAQGRALYEQLPCAEYSREIQIWEALEEDEKLENAYEVVRTGYWMMLCGIWRLMDSKALPDAQQEAIAQKRLALEALAEDPGAPVPVNGQWRMLFARVLARQGKAQEAAQQLRIAAQQAIAFDRRPESGTSCSTLLGERHWKRSDYETADDRPLVHILRDVWLQHADFDGIRTSEAFRQAEAFLQNV